MYYHVSQIFYIITYTLNLLFFQTGRLISLIACEGRMIRVLEHGRVTLSMEVDSAPTVLYILDQDEEKHVLFGTVDGRVGVLDIKK